MTSQLTIPVSALAEVQTVPFTALTFTTKATLNTVQQYNPVCMELYEEAARLGLTPVGGIQYVYTDITGDETREFQLEIALPISGAEVASEKFAVKTFEPFSCVSYTFRGSWSDFMPMYDALFAAFYQAGYKTDNRVREVYNVVDFENRANCVTDIQISLA